MTPTPRRSARRLAAAALLVGAVGLAACGDGYGDDDDSDDEGAAATTEVTEAAAEETDGDATAAGAADLVGATEDGDTFVALVAQADGSVLAYACDGEEGEVATTSEWFTGEVEDGEISLLSASGARLEASVSPTGSSGRLVLGDGSVRPFEAAPAVGTAGLYRGEQDDFLGGFIVANDGSDRGSMGTNFGQDRLARPAFRVSMPDVLVSSAVGTVPFQRMTAG